ncbi:MAG: hypothetical protein ACYTGC_17655, partial [Planctomycetota bacterium]
MLSPQGAARREAMLEELTGTLTRHHRRRRRRRRALAATGGVSAMVLLALVVRTPPGKLAPGLGAPSPTAIATAESAGRATRPLIVFE